MILRFETFFFFFLYIIIKWKQFSIFDSKICISKSIFIRNPLVGYILNSAFRLGYVRLDYVMVKKIVFKNWYFWFTRK